MKPREPPKKKPEEEPTFYHSAAKAPKVVIPDNLKALSAKELMKLLDQLGMRRDDCFEKVDLIRRVEEY